MDQENDTPHTRYHFYVGGNHTETKSGRYFCNQMYVERLTPLSTSRQPYPVVLVHGRGQSGTAGCLLCSGVYLTLYRIG